MIMAMAITIDDGNNDDLDEGYYNGDDDDMNQLNKIYDYEYDDEHCDSWLIV